MTTLGIIGIVAAMTLPLLIGKYQKKQTVEQLKSTYSLLSQVFVRSQAEYGDPVNWDVNTVYGSSDAANSLEVLDMFCRKHILHFIKILENYKYTSFKNIGYKSIYHLNGNADNTALGSSGYMFRLANGTILKVSLDGHCYGESTNEDGNSSCSDWRITNVVMYVDINGLQKPNTIGKDLFVMMYKTSNAKFGFYTYGYSRDFIREQYCNGTSIEDRQCGQLIFLDGWEIKDDYPW